MKIGIVTLPLHSNYGGILQAYALKKSLEELGHQAILLDHASCIPKRLPIKVRYLVYLKRFFVKVFLRKDIIVCKDKYDRSKYLDRLSEINKFVSTYIQANSYNIGSKQLPKFDAIVVGSDQVWRTAYANPIEKFFLDFLDGVQDIRKVVYAASFGVDNWDYTPLQTANCARLAKQFDSISVREDSGIDLCRKYLGVTAVQVLDPTMLLDKEDYLQIVETEQIPKSKGNLFTYILDENNQKQDYIQKVASKLGLTPFSVLPTDTEINDGKKFLGVPVWLRAFEDAEFVVTDSFHGCVFSIIFNKPFIAIKNEDRGLDRFLSLFRLFNLEDRLVDLQELSLECLPHNIDWNRVNITRETMKKESMIFLSKNLQK